MQTDDQAFDKEIQNGWKFCNLFNYQFHFHFLFLLFTLLDLDFGDLISRCMAFPLLCLASEMGGKWNSIFSFAFLRCDDKTFDFWCILEIRFLLHRIQMFPSLASVLGWQESNSNRLRGGRRQTNSGRCITILQYWNAQNYHKKKKKQKARQTSSQKYEQCIPMNPEFEEKIMTNQIQGKIQSKYLKRYQNEWQRWYFLISKKSTKNSREKIINISKLKVPPTH